MFLSVAFSISDSYLLLPFLKQGKLLDCGSLIGIKTIGKASLEWWKGSCRCLTGVSVNGGFTLFHENWLLDRGLTVWCDVFMEWCVIMEYC